MKRRTRQLKDSAIESLTLSVEVFNRPSPVARAQGVMLPLQHAFEMLLKAAVWERRGAIQPKGATKSWSLRECLGMLRGYGLLDEDECVVVATISATRDGVQHHSAAVSEERLYVNAASGLRVFDDLLQRVVSERLADQGGFAQRMLPGTVNPPRELHLLTGGDVDQVRELLRPSVHHHAEARALLRTLVLSDRAATAFGTPRAGPSPRRLLRVQFPRLTCRFRPLSPLRAAVSLLRSTWESASAGVLILAQLASVCRLRVVYEMRTVLKPRQALCSVSASAVGRSA